MKMTEDESGLNNFMDYTMFHANRYAPFFGFTEEEVKALCKKYNMDFDSITKWYGGYENSGIKLYNPDSVVRALKSGNLMFQTMKLSLL